MKQDVSMLLPALHNEFHNELLIALVIFPRLKRLMYRVTVGYSHNCMSTMGTCFAP